MKATPWIPLFALVAHFCLTGGAFAMEPKRVTTVMYTEDVDAAASFYVERLGFEQTIAVPNQAPGGTGHQFVALRNGAHELMLQTFQSAEAGAPGTVAPASPPSYMLYLEVPSLDDAIGRMHGLEPAIARQKTFYGSEEIGYRDPNGTVVVFAEFAQEPAAPDAGQP